MPPWMPDASLAIAHHLMLLPLVAVLFAEWLLLARPLDGARLAQLGRLDAAYGALATGLLLAGFSRAVWGAKGWDWYSGNPLFWTKVALFVVIGLLSIVPTVRLLRWRRARAVPDARAQQRVRRWVGAEVALLAVLPVLAVLMARGVGL